LEQPTTDSLENELLSPETVDPEEPATFRSLMTPRILITLVNYAFTVFIESASSSILPLLYASPISYGGLNLSSFQIGIILTTSGIILGLSSMLFFPILSRRLGLTNLYRVGFAGHLVTNTTYALMNVFARRSGRVDGFVLALLAVQLTFVNFTVMTFSKYSACSILITSYMNIAVDSLYRLHVYAHQRRRSKSKCPRHNQWTCPNSGNFLSYIRTHSGIVAFFTVAAASFARWHHGLLHTRRVGTLWAARFIATSTKVRF
jgi:hypothetical protein